jgi:hypothetical protein
LKVKQDIFTRVTMAKVEFLLRLAPDLVLTDVLGRADLSAMIRAVEELHEGREMVQAEKKADVKRRFGFRVPEEYRR